MLLAEQQQKVSQKSALPCIHRLRPSVSHVRSPSNFDTWAGNAQEEDSAFGTYAGSGGKRLVYRERTPAGNYRIIEQTVDEAMTREQMLDMRATKKADRHCN